MNRFTGLVTGLSRVLDRIAGFSMAAIMVLVTLNILLREIFGRPIPGTYEFVGFLTTVMFSLALAYCAARGGHIAVSIVMERFSPKVQAAVEIMVNAAAAVFWAAAAWHAFIFAQGKAVNNVVSSTMQVPVYPFIAVLALGLLVLCLVLLAGVVESAKKVIEDR